MSLDFHEFSIKKHQFSGYSALSLLPHMARLSGNHNTWKTQGTARADWNYGSRMSNRNMYFDRIYTPWLVPEGWQPQKPWMYSAFLSTLRDKEGERWHKQKEEEGLLDFNTSLSFSEFIKITSKYGMCKSRGYIYVILENFERTLPQGDELWQLCCIVPFSLLAYQWMHMVGQLNCQLSM